MFDFSKFDNTEEELQNIRKMKKDFPNMPSSLKNRLDDWEKSHKGDIYATMKLSLELGVITQEQFEDFHKIDLDVNNSECCIEE